MFDIGRQYPHLIGVAPDYFGCLAIGKSNKTVDSAVGCQTGKNRKGKKKKFNAEKYEDDQRIHNYLCK